jgi:hypothetical protein
MSVLVKKNTFLAASKRGKNRLQIEKMPAPTQWEEIA